MPSLQIGKTAQHIIQRFYLVFDTSFGQTRADLLAVGGSGVVVELHILLVGKKSLLQEIGVPIIFKIVI